MTPTASLSIPAHRLPLSLRLGAGVLLMAALAACNPSAPPKLDATGSATKVYIVTEKNVEQVRLRALDTVNNLRQSNGLTPLMLDPALVQAADAHSASMQRQNRAWAFGEDGSTPVSRARAAGFQGRILGELVSETYESEVRAIATWMGQPAQKAIVLDPSAQRMGFGVSQQENNKLWWTLTIAE